jgi:hypothetical protein
MKRAPAVGLLFLLGAAGVDPLTAQTTVRIGGGSGSVDFTCGTCEIDAESGFGLFAAAARPVGRLLSVGFEGTGSDVKLEGRPRGDDEVRLVAALATAGVTAGTRTPLWATLGLGWIWYSGVGGSSSGPALSLRAGLDIQVAGPLALSPYAGVLTMIGHDGPHHVTDFIQDPDGDPTRVRSLQLGLAATIRPSK